MSPMTMLLIRCPNTNKLVGTNVQREKASFEVEPLPDQPAIHCAGCGDLHTWGKQDVVAQTWTWASGPRVTWAW